MALAYVSAKPSQMNSSLLPRIVDVFKYNGTVHMVQKFIDAPLLWQVWPKLGLMIGSSV